MAPESSFSQTAAYIAIKFYGLTQIPEYRALFNEETIELYDRQVCHLPGQLHRYHYWLTNKKFRDLVISLEELLLPGDLLHILQRKWVMQKLFTCSMHEGYKQLIVLGSGFDHLSLIATRWDITAIEIDTPATLHTKKAILESAGYDLQEVQQIGAKLTNQNLNKILHKQNTVDPNKNTLIVAEGFWDYLSEDFNEQIADSIAGYFKRQVRIASTIFDLTRLDSWYRWIYRGSIRMVGEKLASTTTIPKIKKRWEDRNFKKIYLKNAAALKTEMFNNPNPLTPLSGFSVILMERK